MSQLFEDCQTCLPHQIEFVLEKAPEKPSFQLFRRVFGRVQPNAEWGFHPKADFKNWVLEKGTIITAIADSCRGFDYFNKKRCLRIVLSVFKTPSEMLAKDGGGRDALEIAIDNVDCVALDMFVEHLREYPCVFENYSVVDRILDRLLDDPPSHIADSVRKERIITYRRDLGHMVHTMLDAGDRGNSDNARSGLCARIVEHITNEFPILLIGFMQRGGSELLKEKFAHDVEELANAFMTTLCYCRDNERNEVFQAPLKKGLTKLLSTYFGVSFRRSEISDRLGAQMVLTPKRNQISLQGRHMGIRKGKQPEGTMSLRWPESDDVHGVKYLLDWNLYRKIIVTELRISSPTNTFPIPRLATVPIQY
jgi:hypothetical protein